MKTNPVKILQYILTGLTLSLVLLAVILLGLRAVPAIPAAAGSSSTGGLPLSPQAITPSQWAAIQGANQLLLEQGNRTFVFLPLVDH